MSAFWRVVAVLAILTAALIGIAQLGVDADEARIMQISGFGK